VSVDGGQTWTTANAGGQSTIGRQGRNTVLYRAADAAGNAAAGLGGTLSLDVDSVAPAIAATDPVFLQGHAATPAWTCTDATSGVASCTASAIDTSTPGTRSFTITATDNAGLATTVTRSYTVLPATSVQGDVGGTVPATLALTLGGPASFGAFAPGVEMTYEATATAKVVSTAGDATLSVSGPARLANGAFVLPQPLQVAGVPKAWSAPVSNEPVALTFRQPIGATDALRTGTYSTTLVFTLSSTAP
jgi:X-Pro dipeptidyl-peptidase